MLTPAISVVIPIYNQEKYLGKCIRSVLNQTFQDFEVILVNDGSTDNSLKICQKYAKRDKRVSIVEKQNEGLAQARKDGFLKACGEYVCFLDSDDYLALDALELLFGIAKENGVDMVVGNFDKVFDNWGMIRKKPELYHCHLTDKLITKKDVMSLMMGLENMHDNWVWGVFAWGRIYKRKCILDALSSNQGLLFPISKEMKSEDDAFNIAISPYLESIWITNTIVSHYRYGGVSSGDMPYIREAGYLYDERFERCFLYHCKQALPLIYERYVFHLKYDMVKQLHFHISSEKQLYDFVEKEINERKIVLWARQNIVSIPDHAKDKDLQQAVLDNDVHKIIECAHEWEGFLQRVHYPKMKWVGVYQKIVDRIGKYC